MTPKFILASNSPRRRELLTMLGMDFTVKVSECDESIPIGTPPDKAVSELALRKARAVYETLGAIDHDTFIIAADTVVCDQGHILGKPADKADAYRTFFSFSEREHSVMTGVAVIGHITKDGEHRLHTASSTVETRVVFGRITEAEARAYVATGEPMDKAGSYGIQGIGGFFVTELHGDYYNVVGLPIARMRELLESEFGLCACDYISKR